MIGSLDFRTLTLATGAVVLALTAAMLWVRLTRRTYPGFDLWMAGAACAALAMLTGWTGGLYPQATAVASNTVASLGMALVIAGLEDFLGRARRTRLHLLLVGGTLLTSVLFTWSVPWVRGRVLSGEALYATQVAWCLWLVVRGIPPLLGGPNRLLEGVLLLQGGWSAVRVVLLLAADSLPEELLSGAAAQVTFLVYPVVSALLVFGLTALDLQRVEADLRASMDEVRTLRGIIPICAYCKKIRDDQGSWEQVEAYMSRHTDAAFSHGICPRCMESHFPEEPRT
jgi:hypothetical protein